MNLFQIIFKNMRQRALGTWLTLLSVTLGVALAIAVLIVFREGKSLFGQTEFGYDVIVGINRGSPLQLVMNTVYDIDQSPGNVSYSLYESLLSDPRYRPDVKIAVPIAVGDSYMNHRIVATLPKMFGFADDGVTPLPEDHVIEYKKGEKYIIENGKSFNAYKFGAVIGADITRETGLKMGQEFQITHGLPMPGQVPDIHAEHWKVVGQLKRTGTAADHVIYIALPTYYAIAEHESGLAAQAVIRAGGDTNAALAAGAKASTSPAGDDGHHYDLNPDGTIDLHLPKKDWVVSAILVKARGGEFSGGRVRELIYNFSVRNDALAVNPAQVMREFFDNFLKGSFAVLLLISVLVTVVAAVGILVSIYNSVAARKREIAILRALGATRGLVLTIICLEAALIGLVGSVLGLVLGHAALGVGSLWLKSFLGQGIAWVTVDKYEWLYLLGVVILSALAGLVPAAAAYKTPVATNLVTN
jgi:putative ABC transport system permease protein